jgi:GNAT superfamily N-acetyltransferase
MAYEIRSIEADQWSEALQLWEEVYEVGQWLFDSLHRGTTGRKWAHCGVALDDDGRIVSAVDLFMRQVRDANGEPVKVAAVGSVATLERARKQGLSGKLLERALEVMAEEQCAWSHLFTGTHHHYRRYGWLDAPLRTRTGRLRSLDSPQLDAKVLSDDEKDESLNVLKTWWEADNLSRPLTHVRTDLYWKEAIRPRLGQGSIHQNRQVILACQSEEPCGYAVVEVEGDWAKVLETGGDHRTVLHGVARVLGEKEVVFDLPFDEPWNEAIASVAKDLVEQEEPWSMARGLPAGISDEHVRSIFGAPGAHHWQLDNF